MKLSVPLSLALYAIDTSVEWDAMSIEQAIKQTKLVRRNGTIIIKRKKDGKSIILSKEKNGMREVKWMKSNGSPTHPTIVQQSSLSDVAWRVWLASMPH